MTDAAKEARRAYKRAWNKANPDKVKKHQENYWQKRAEQSAQTTAGKPIDTTASTTTP